MRQFTISRLLIAFLMMLCCSTAMASDFVTVDGFKFLVDTDKDEATLLANDYSGDIVVPEKVCYEEKDYPVVVIGKGCFGYGVTNVKMPNTITVLEESSFKQCHVEELEIPNSVQNIGENCFENSSIVKISLPEGISEIPSMCFFGCTQLQKLKLPNSVTRIGSMAFYDCSSLVDLSLNEGLFEIGNRAFTECVGLKTITMPLSLYRLGTSVFADCKNLKTIKSLASTPPSAYIDTFSSFDSRSCVLLVPQNSVDSYKKTSPWENFGIIKAIDGQVPDEGTVACSFPIISYTSGTLSFESSTSGAEYHYTINDSDVATDKYNTDGKVLLNGKLDISVYATADGYKASDKATATLYWLNAEGGDDTNNINLVKTRGVMITTDTDITISGLNDGEVVTFYSVNGVNLGSAKAVQGVLHFAKPNESIVIAKIKGNDLKIAIK